MDKLVSFIISVLLIIAVLCFLMASPILFAQQESQTQDQEFNLVIEDIRCRGNESTDCSFITKKFYQNIGEIVNPNEIADARLRLGTLQQFKNIRIVLEKGSRRGHVNVVFIVDEADQIQYLVTSGYSNINRNRYDGDSFTVSTGITNFNFLGSGKELRFQLTHNLENNERTNLLSNPPLQDRLIFSDSELKDYSARLSYYDPHLLDSASYYFSADLSYHKTDHRSTNREIVENEEFTFGSGADLNEDAWFISLGRRFGSHSFVEVHTGSVDGRGSTNSYAYGWDSRDDLVFPTQGTTFSIRAHDVTNNALRSLNFKFSQHLSLNDDWVLGYELFDSVINQQFKSHTKNALSSASINLTNFTTRDSKNGYYTGWRYRLFSQLHGPEDNYASAGVSYIYQTDKLLMSFSLNYDFD